MPFEVNFPLPAFGPAACGPLRLRRPPALQAGDRVRVIAPGGAFDPLALAQGLAVLRAWQLVPVLGRLPERHHVYAGDDDVRAQGLCEALEDLDAAALWAVRGGSGTGRILAACQATLARTLRARPRWLVGFSDITALHAQVAALGLQSLHAANLVNLAAWTPAAQAGLRGALGLAGGEAAAEAACEATLCSGVVPNGLAGWLVGGNLTVLASVVGCGVLPSWEGAVLFVEDIAEAPYRLDRALAQLRQSGALRGVRAVLVGQLTRCGAPEQVRALLADTLQPLGIPLLAGLPWGHEANSRAVVLGARAVLQTGDKPPIQVRCLP